MRVMSATTPKRTHVILARRSALLYSPEKLCTRISCHPARDPHRRERYRLALATDVLRDPELHDAPYEVARQRLAKLGWAVVPVQNALPEVHGEIMAPSFSGWPLFTRASLPDELVSQMCQALEEAGDRTVWDSEDPVTMADLCGGGAAAPFDVPLHPGAKRYYQARGYLPS